MIQANRRSRKQGSKKDITTQIELHAYVEKRFFCKQHFLKIISSFLNFLAVDRYMSGGSCDL